MNDMTPEEAAFTKLPREIKTLSYIDARNIWTASREMQRKIHLALIAFASVR